MTQFGRDRLRAGVTEPFQFIVLSADPSVIQQRLTDRPQHFMKRRMLGSQMAALEQPVDAIVVDVSRSLDEVCTAVVNAIRNLEERSP